MPRRIATMAALITLASTLTAAPIALAANCEAGFVGPYGTACGGDTAKTPIEIRVIPPKGSSTTTVAAPREWNSGVGGSDTLSEGTNRSARGFGSILLGGMTDAKTTKKYITPTDGRDSVVVVVPGNPTRITVRGFQKSGTTVQIMLQASGRAEREVLGFSIPIDGTLTLPTSTVAQGDRATYTLNEWVGNRSGVVLFAMGLISQQRITIVGTGVPTTSTHQLRRRTN